MNKKILTNGLIVGFALFSTFFGAGNLIFPPSIGLLSGDKWIMGALGLFCSGILLPVIAVIAVNNSGGNIRNLLDPISSWFYDLFYLIMVLLLANGSTLPKLAATTHEMGIKALTDKIPMQVTIVVFFIIIFLLTINQKSVVEKLGKYLTPLLLFCLVIIVIAAIIFPVGTPVKTDIQKPFVDAVITGYNTGDLTLGLMCSGLFFAALKDAGLKGKDFNKGVYITALVAITGLTIVYIGLLYLGATGHELVNKDMSMATMLIVLVEQLLGKIGSGILAIVVILACITTGVGIATIGAGFISEITKGKISYKVWLIISCVIAGFLGILGVNKIVYYAGFMFCIIYPICIVVTFLGLIKPYLKNDGPFKGGVLVAAIFSIMDTFVMFGFNIPIFKSIISKMPFSNLGFSWVIPSLIGMIIGSFIVKNRTPEIR